MSRIRRLSKTRTPTYGQTPRKVIGPPWVPRRGLGGPLRYLLVWLHLTSITCLGAPSPDAPTSSTSPTAAFSVLRAHGQRAMRLSFARKRAFKRAQARALRDGSTVYRGQHHNMQSLSLQYIGQARPRPPRRSNPDAPDLLQVITWNCGGLHANRYTELMAWLNSEPQHCPHIILVQECHWPQSMEFSSDKWVHIYSGSGSQQGGVMIILSRQLVHPNQVRYVELCPGRLLHARLALDPPIDVLCVYQHAWSVAGSSQQPGQSRMEVQSVLLEKRRLLWQSLHNWVASVPR